MRVVFCSSEVVPFAKTGGLADVCGALPIALEQVGIDVNIILPRYQSIDQKKYNLKKLNKEVSTTTIGQNIHVYFIEHEKFFDRPGLYGDANGDYPDNLDRFQFFCHETLEVLKRLNIKSDIIHCHDWQTALIPIYLKSLFDDDKFYAKTKSVLTIHNLAYQGLFSKGEYPKLNLPNKYFGVDGFEFYNKINLLKGGILYGDCLTTVSPGYAQEVQTEKFGCGLAEILHKREKDFIGVLNGVDYKIWNPETDSLIKKPFSAKKIKDKYENKKFLQQRTNLPEKENVPLIGFVARLDYQKGIDIFAEALEEIMRLNVQIILLGLGEEKYQKIMKDLSAQYGDKFICYLQFDEEIAHQIYAGADMLLMPSRYEPCGLSQMISLRYGTIPIVFKTGGLGDTIFPCKDPHGRGNGFVFEDYSARGLTEAVKNAITVYQDKDTFRALVKKSFQHDFSWNQSAKKYQELYTQCIASE